MTNRVIKPTGASVTLSMATDTVVVTGVIANPSANAFRVTNCTDKPVKIAFGANAGEATNALATGYQMMSAGQSDVLMPQVAGNVGAVAAQAVSAPSGAAPVAVTPGMLY